MSPTSLAFFFLLEKASEENLLPSLRSHCWAEALPSLWVCWVNGSLMLGTITGLLHMSLPGVVAQPWLVRVPSPLSSQIPFPCRAAGPGLSPAGNILGGYFQAIFLFSTHSFKCSLSQDAWKFLFVFNCLHKMNNNKSDFWWWLSMSQFTHQLIQN